MCGKCRQSQVSIARIEVEREEEEVEGRRGWKEGERGVKNGSASITLRGYICRVIPPHSAAPLPASSLPLPVVLWRFARTGLCALLCLCVSMFIGRTGSGMWGVHQDDVV